MKKIIIILLLVIFSIFLFSCSNDSQDSEVPPSDPDPEPSYNTTIFYDNIEQGVKEWIVTPPTGRWIIVTGYSYSLTRCWSDSTTTYTNNSTATLTSKNFDLTNYVGSIKLTFWNAYDVEENYDFIYVEYSIDNGTVWTKVWAATGKKYFWDKEEIIVEDVGGQSTFKIRFSLVSDPTNVYDGWFIDEIKLSGNVE